MQRKSATQYVVALLVALGLVCASVLTASGVAAQSEGRRIAGRLPSAVTPVPIITGADDQIRPSLAYNGPQDEYLLVWQSGYEQDEPRQLVRGDIYAQRLSLDGTPIGQPLQINTDTEHQSRAPHVVYNARQDEYLVVWQRYVGGGPSGIWGRRVSSSGQPIGQDYAIATASGGSQQHPRAACAMDGTCFVAWYDGRNRNTTEDDVYGVLLDTGGRPVGIPTAICTKAEPQQDIDVCYDPGTQEYLVAWSDSCRDSTTCDVYAQRISAAGALVGGEIPLSTQASWQSDPALAPGGAGGGWLAVWQDSRADGANADVYARRVGPGGSLAAEHLVRRFDHEQIFPAVAHDGTGQYLVAWQDSRDEFRSAPPRYDIYGHCVDSDGQPIGSEFLICKATGDQRWPDVSFASSRGSYLVVWQDSRSGNYDLYGAVVTSCATAVSSPSCSRMNPVARDVTANDGDTVTLTVQGDQLDQLVRLQGVKWYVDGVFQVEHTVSGYSDTDTFSVVARYPNSTVVRAEVYNQRGLSCSVDWSIQPQAPASPPTCARANPTTRDYTANDGEIVNLTMAADQADRLTELRSVTWYVDGVAQPERPLSGYSATNTFAVTARYPNSTVVRAEVYNQRGLSCSVDWSIQPQAPASPPTCSRLNPTTRDYTANDGETVNLTVSAEQPDRLTELRSVTWYVDGVAQPARPLSGYSITDTFAVTARYPNSTVVRAEVYNQRGLSCSVDWSIQPQAPASPPTCSRLNPTTRDYTANDGETVNLTVSAEQPDRLTELRSVTWYVDGVAQPARPLSGYSATDSIAVKASYPSTAEVKAVVCNSQGQCCETDWRVRPELACGWLSYESTDIGAVQTGKVKIEDLAYRNRKGHLSAVRYNVPSPHWLGTVAFYVCDFEHRGPRQKRSQMGEVRLLVLASGWKQVLYEATVRPEPGGYWLKHELSKPTLVDGEFYVAMEWLAEEQPTPQPPLLGVDKSSKNDGNSYLGFLGQPGPPQPVNDKHPILKKNARFMIRACVQRAYSGFRYEELNYDQASSPDGCGKMKKAGNKAAVRFTPVSAGIVTALRFYVADAPVPVRVSIWSADRQVRCYESGEILPDVVAGGEGWWTHAIPGDKAPAVTDDFWAMLEWSRDWQKGDLKLGYTRTAPDGRSYQQYDGSFDPLKDFDLMIRAVMRLES